MHSYDTRRATDLGEELFDGIESTGDFWCRFLWSVNIIENLTKLSQRSCMPSTIQNSHMWHRVLRVSTVRQGVRVDSFSNYRLLQQIYRICEFEKTANRKSAKNFQLDFRTVSIQKFRFAQELNRQFFSGRLLQAFVDKFRLEFSFDLRDHLFKENVRNNISKHIR